MYQLQIVYCIDNVKKNRIYIYRNYSNKLIIKIRPIELNNKEIIDKGTNHKDKNMRNFLYVS